MSLDKIKWGIIGCGNIANKFCLDLAMIEDAVIVAVASRSVDKAQSFANIHHAKKAYGNYDELFSDKDVDIVYIATPHVSHAELSMKAMKNGKHVLCEKPLSLNALEAAAIIETSKQSNRFFMEALWSRFNPSIVEIKKRIDNGEIGQIKYINAEFSFKSDKPINSRVLNLDLGGGAILDIGIYPAFLAYLILGFPKEIMAKSIFHEITKCDMQTAMIFNYDQAQAILYSGFTSNSVNSARISGITGQIIIDDSWHNAQEYRLIKNNKEKIFKLPTSGEGFRYEIIECHECIRAGKTESEFWSHENSLDLISILDEVRDKVGLVYPQERLV